MFSTGGTRSGASGEHAGRGAASRLRNIFAGAPGRAIRRVSRGFPGEGAVTGAPRPPAAGIWRRLRPARGLSGLLAAALFAVCWGAAAQAQVLSIVDTSVAEGNSGTTTMTFTVSLSASSLQAVTVDWATSTETGDTATSGTDFTGASGTLTIAVGDTSGTISVDVTGDTVDEVDETFTVTLSNPGNATVSSTAGTATGTITDDDGPILSIVDASVAEGDSGTAALSFTVSLSASSLQAVTVDWATSTETGDTATSGTDFTGASGTLTIAVGDTSGTISVDVTGDTVDEVDETFTVTLSNPGNATVSSTAGTATGTITDDDGPILSIVDASVAEGDSGTTALSFTVSLSASSLQAVTVDWATSTETGDTATSGTDFTGASGTLTIAVGDTSGTISVDVTGDTVDEVDETFTVTLSNPGNATVSSTAGTATGTITDDDGPILSIVDASVAEGDSGTTALSFTVSLSASSLQAVTVDWATSTETGDTATSGTDFTGASGTLTIAVGDTSGTISVDVTGDTVDEVDETFTVTLSNPGNATVSGTAGTATGTITDDDGPILSIVDASVAEGDSGTTALSFTVSLSASSLQAVTVDWATSTETGDTATSGTDFTGASGTLTIAVGDTSGTISVDVTGDTVDEVDETFTVTLSNPGNATVSSTAGTATGTITNDDDPVLSIAAASVAEGDSGTTALSFTVSLSASSLQAVTVDWATSTETGDTATSGTDFTGASGTLTIAVGDTSGTISVDVTGDTVDEVDETFTVTLSNPGNATVSSTAGTATGTITDDDGPILSIVDASVAEGDSGTTALSFTVSLSASSLQAVTVDWATSTETGDTATSGTDFTGASGTLTIAVGDTSGTISVDVTGDTVDEVDETFTVTLSNPGNATISGTAGTATGTITDDDGPILSIVDASVAEGDSGTTALSFTVSLSASSLQAVTVDWATSTETGDTATSGTDFTGASGTLTIAVGDTSGTISVDVTGDTVDEVDETFTVTLSNPGNATVSSTAGTATGTITDDDGPILSIVDASVAEGDSGTAALSFTVSLSASSLQAVTVDWATSTETGDTATSGTDFTGASGTLTIAVGDTSGTISVDVTGDTVDEVDETFTVTLSNPGNATISSTAGTATGTITDDDGPILSIVDASVAEGDSGTAALSFTVSLSASSLQAVTVDWATSTETGDTATSGTDFTGASGTLTIAVGDTSGTISVDVTGDTVDEVDETFTVTLSNPGNATVSGTAGTATGTITDDDGPILSIVDASVAEGDSGTTALSFTVSLSASSLQAVTVDWATSTETGDTATSGTDFTGASGTLTIAVGDTSGTISVDVTGDTVDEVDETFTVTLSNPGNATISGTAGTATGTITSDDDPVLSIAAASVVEGDSGATAKLQFTVTLTGNSTDAVTVDWATADGTAIAPGDYTAVTDGSLSFAAAAQTQTKIIEVDVVGDAVDEVDETFTVTLSNPGNATISGTAGTATGTITNDDDPVLSIAAASVVEGDSGATAKLQFTVTLTGNSTDAVTVDWATADGTAIAPGDYTAVTDGSLSFAAAAQTQTKIIEVDVVGDAVDEVDETFTVTLSNPGNATISGTAGTATGTITNDDDPVLSIAAASVVEGDSGATAKLQFTVTLTGNSTDAVTVDWATADGTAIAPGDYTAVTDGSLSFAAAAQTQTKIIEVDVVGDAVDEVDETFTVTLSLASGETDATISGTAGTAGTATGTITDDDASRTLTVSDAAVDEGDAAQFTVTLSGAVAADVTVAWRTVDGTAKVENGDYEKQSGTLTFTQSNTEFERTVTVPTVRDSVAEGNETFTVELLSETVSVSVDGLSVPIADADGTGTILDDVEDAAMARLDRVNEEILPRVTQAMAASTVSAVAGRIEAVTSGAPITNVADRSFFYRLLKANERAIDRGSFDLRMLLDGRTFALPLHAGEDGMGGPGGLGGLAFWGSGDYTNLEGRPNSLVEWEGDIMTAHLGMDTRLSEKVLAGMSVSRSRGSFDFTDRTSTARSGGLTVNGTYDSRMTGIHPYVNLSLSEDLGVWAKLGYGRGEVEIDDDQVNDPQSSDTEMTMVAVGATGRLYSDDGLIPGGKAALKLKGEGALSQVVLEGNGKRINPLTSDIQRLRMLLEGSYAREMASGAVVTPALEIGVRHDGGDGVTGTGLELGGSLRVFEPSHGVTVEGRGRILLAHEDEYEEWGVGGLVRVDPGADGRGLSVSLAPVYGDTASGTARLWDRGMADKEASDDNAAQMRLDSELGYGFDALGGRGVLTPYGGLSLAGEGAQSYRFGGRFGLGSALDLSLEGERREPADAGAVEHGVMLRMQVRW